jgi:hypothetical protein
LGSSCLSQYCSDLVLDLEKEFLGATGKPILNPDISTTSPSEPFLEIQTKSYLSLYPYCQVLALFLLANTPLGMYPSKTL